MAGSAENDTWQTYLLSPKRRKCYVYRRFVSAKTPVLISATVFGAPRNARHPNTSLVRVRANTGKDFSSTPCAACSTMRLLPACQPKASRTTLGRMIRPFVERTVVSFSVAGTMISSGIFSKAILRQLSCAGGGLAHLPADVSLKSVKSRN